MSADLVAALLARKESRTFEVKRLRGGELTKCLQTITAFANTDGGLLVLGLEDPDKAHGGSRIYGIEENEAAIDDLRRQLHTRVQPIMGGDLGPEPVFQTISCDLRDGNSGRLLAIQVRPSRDLHSIVDGGTWERLDKGNRQLSASEITERRFRLGAASILDQPVDVQLDLLETNWWQDYRNQRDILRPLAEALPQLGLAKLVEGALKPARLAVLLFAEFPADLLGEKCAVRLFHYRGDQIEHSGSTTNLLKPPRTIGGTALNQIRASLRAVEEELASGLQVSSMGFEMVQRYPRRAIQEAITNAVVHRDYAIPRDIHIRIFSDRIEVESPGALPHRLQISDLGRSRSCPRNLSLVNHLREFSAPPNQDAGEGILMMRSLMQKADLYPPIYQESKTALGGTLTVALRNQSRPTTWDRVSDYLDKHGDLNNTEVRKIIQTEDTLKVSKLLKSWVEVGLLEVVNPEAAKQLRRYRKTGLASDIFAWLARNESAPKN